MVIRRATWADLEPLQALYDEFHPFHVHGVPGYLRVPDAEETDLAAFVKSLEHE